MARFTKNKAALITSILLVISIAGNAFLYFQYRQAEDKNPDIQTERIVGELEKMVNLPDETPSVLTVVDKSKLADSQIAKNAENGDKILLYQQAGQVIIYRPSTNKLVNILSLGADNASQSESQTPNTNGTTTSP